MLAKAALALTGASLLAAACAPATQPANVPVKTTGGLLTQVVDSTNDVGRSPAAAIGKDGPPEVAYLLVKATLKPGQIPPPLVPNTPQPPAVVVATFLSQQGYWSRTSATAQDYVHLKGTAQGLAYSDGSPIPGVTDAMAVDAAGHRHVVYSSPFGLFYTTDAATPPNSAPVFATPKQITNAPTLGASIAVAADGTPWVAYYLGDTVRVATLLKGKTWFSEPVGLTTSCGDCPPVRTAIAVTPNGAPIVAFVDAGKADPEVEFVPPPGASGATFVPTTVEAGAGGYGISLALGKDGSTHLAFYGRDGSVSEADSSGGLTGWTVHQLAPAAPKGSAAGDVSGWTTGVGVDDAGTVYATWADPATHQVMFAEGTGGTFRSQVVPESVGGVNPSLAVSGDGKNLVLPFYDGIDHHLNVATFGSTALAVPSPTPSPPPTGPAGPACKPTGSTALSIVAKGTAFNVSCLAAPPSTSFTVNFNNQDAGVPHNFDIYKDPGYTQHLAGANGVGDTITGPTTTTYSVQGLPAGTYYFRCDIHPTVMTGIFVVAKATGGGASPTPAPTSS